MKITWCEITVYFQASELFFYFPYGQTEAGEKEKLAVPYLNLRGCVYMFTYTLDHLFFTHDMILVVAVRKNPHFIITTTLFYVIYYFLCEKKSLLMQWRGKSLENTVF